MKAKKRLENTHGFTPNSNEMNTIRVTLLALTLSPVLSMGGQIYGTIKEGGKPIEKGVKIEITTEGGTGYPASTDQFGNYRIIVPETGKCTITVWFRGQPIRGDIQSYWGPVRFDWALEKTGEGYLLKRQ
jgi:hypothetical protein